jgi:hypothetical protein
MPARERNIPMIADAVMAPKRPERDEMLEHDAHEETAEKGKKEINRSSS